MSSLKVSKNPLLLLLSALYAMAVWLRNYFFDKGWIKSVEFDLPIIGVGNLTVGGTGKTPHVEYIANLLRKKCHVAVLSRGYRRRTKGFRLADADSTAADIGDEPYQMHSKFPDVTVCVDADRVNGIKRLLTLYETRPIDVVLLDDAYQHRYVKPGLNILLTDYNRLITEDRLLPAGRLREPAVEKDRANVIVVTKCPTDMQPFDVRVVTKKIDARPYQQLFLTTVAYGRKYPLFPQKENTKMILNKDTNALIVVGVANPEGLVEEINKVVNVCATLVFPDHHNFSSADIAKINRAFTEMSGMGKVIITTEKDACRLIYAKALAPEVKRAIIVQPITIDFLEQGREAFNDIIYNYVRKNQRNRGVAKR